MSCRIRRWFEHFSSSSHWQVMELQSLVKKVGPVRFKGLTQVYSFESPSVHHSLQK